MEGAVVYRYLDLRKIGTRDTRRAAWKVLTHGANVTNTTTRLAIMRDVKRILSAYQYQKESRKHSIDRKVFNAWCKSINDHTRALIELVSHPPGHLPGCDDSFVEVFTGRSTADTLESL